MLQLTGAMLILGSAVYGEVSRRKWSVVTSCELPEVSAVFAARQTSN